MPDLDEVLAISSLTTYSKPCFFFVSAQTNLSGSGPNRCERYELEYGRIVVANR